jgi:hypothetical protein
MNSGPILFRLRTLWTVLGRTGRVALVVGAVAIVVLLISTWSLVGAIFTSAPASDARVVQDQKQQAERYAKGFEGYLSQINGRSLFFTPSPPPRRESRTASAASRPPARYGGPALIGFANDAAYFADGRKLRVGDDSDSTLKLKKVEPPWGAVVVWEGAEFAINLFDRDRLVYPASGLAPEPPKTEPTRTDASAPGTPLTGPPAPEDAKSSPAARPADPAPAPASPRPPEANPKTDSPSTTDTSVPAGTAGESA